MLHNEDTFVTGRRLLQNPSIIGKMCKGEWLNGPQARKRVCTIIDWLSQQAALTTMDNATFTSFQAFVGKGVLLSREPLAPLTLEGYRLHNYLVTHSLRLEQEHTAQPYVDPLLRMLRCWSITRLAAHNLYMPQLS